MGKTKTTAIIVIMNHGKGNNVSKNGHAVNRVNYGWTIFAKACPSYGCLVIGPNVYF